MTSEWQFYPSTERKDISGKIYDFSTKDKTLLFLKQLIASVRNVSVDKINENCLICETGLTTMEKVIFTEEIKRKINEKFNPELFWSRATIADLADYLSIRYANDVRKLIVIKRKVSARKCGDIKGQSLLASLKSMRRKIHTRSPINCKTNNTVYSSTHFGVEISGEEFIPKEGPAIVASNHPFWVDRYIAQRALQKLIKVKRQGEKPVVLMAGFHKYFKWLVSPNVEAVFLSRKHRENDTKVLYSIINLLKQGRIVTLSPEGKQNKGRLRKGKPGAAYLAIKANVPVVPAVIYSKRGLGKLSFEKTRVVFSQPIHFGEVEIKRENLDLATELLMREIAKLLPVEMQGVYKRKR